MTLHGGFEWSLENGHGYKISLEKSARMARITSRGEGKNRRQKNPVKSGGLRSKATLTPGEWRG